jgi:hypothetical protein
LPKNLAITIITISLAVLLATDCAYNPHVEFRFVLPENYIGWVKIDFGDPSGSVWQFNQLKTTVTIPETGVAETQMSFATIPSKRDLVSLFYQNGPDLGPVPSELYSRPVQDNSLVKPFKRPKKSTRYRQAGSWYFFVGPPSLRGPYPSHGKLKPDAKAPTPGRITVPHSPSQANPGAGASALD